MTPDELRELARERREKLGNKETRLSKALDGAADEIERLRGDNDILVASLAQQHKWIEGLRAALHKAIDEIITVEARLDEETGYGFDETKRRKELHAEFGITAEQQESTEGK